MDGEIHTGDWQTDSRHSIRSDAGADPLLYIHTYIQLLGRILLICMYKDFHTTSIRIARGDVLSFFLLHWEGSFYQV